MLADPITIAADSPNPAVNFAVTRSDGYGSERVDTAGGGYSSIINHSVTKNGDRHYLQVLQKKDATDPYTNLTKSVQASASIAIQRPSTGFSDTDMINLVKLLTDTLADADVTVAKLLQFQS